MVASSTRDEARKPYAEFKTVVPAWDNTPRRLERGHSFAFSTPELYQRWLEWAARCAVVNNAPEERFVFINAWNEWGEGAYLEPDQRYGYAYLQATADAINAVSPREGEGI
jgi:lipopolysaccharide biosynthesis protein